MRSNEAYERYLIELEANGTTDSIQSTKGRFIVNYNKSLDRIVEYYIEKKFEDDNRYIQKLKIIDKPISKTKNTSNKDIFLLPKNYFDFIDLNCYASTDKCKDQLFFAKEIKAENINSYLTDEFTKPSFKYRESFYIINEDSITLYKDSDFNFSKLLLSYYRYPQHLKLVDSENPESQIEDVEIEFDDKFINRVITLAAAIHSLNIDDPKYQNLIQQALTKQ